MQLPQADTGTIETLCRLAALDVPEQERRILAGMLERHLAAFQMIEALDLHEVCSAATYEPDWDE